MFPPSKCDCTLIIKGHRFKILNYICIAILKTVFYNIALFEACLLYTSLQLLRMRMTGLRWHCLQKAIRIISVSYTHLFCGGYPVCPGSDRRLHDAASHDKRRNLCSPGQDGDVYKRQYQTIAIAP